MLIFRKMTKYDFVSVLIHTRILIFTRKYPSRHYSIFSRHYTSSGQLCKKIFSKILKFFDLPISILKKYISKYWTLMFTFDDSSFSYFIKRAIFSGYDDGYEINWKNLFKIDSTVKLRFTLKYLKKYLSLIFFISFKYRSFKMTWC
jgi:hypothetical protein